MNKYLTIKEIAELFKVSHWTVRDWINHGVKNNGRIIYLKARKFGKVIRIKEECFEEFLEKIGKDVISVNKIGG